MFWSNDLSNGAFKMFLSFRDFVSTTEHVAVFVWDGLKAQLPNPDILYEVKIYETEKNIIRFRGEYTSWKYYCIMLCPLQIYNWGEKIIK